MRLLRLRGRLEKAAIAEVREGDFKVVFGYVVSWIDESLWTSWGGVQGELLRRGGCESPGHKPKQTMEILSPSPWAPTPSRLSGTHRPLRTLRNSTGPQENSTGTSRYLWALKLRHRTLFTTQKKKAGSHRSLKAYSRSIIGQTYFLSALPLFDEETKFGRSFE